MAQVLQHPSPIVGVDMAPSPREASLDSSANPFARTSEERDLSAAPTDTPIAPISEAFQTSNHLALYETEDSEPSIKHNKHKSLALPHFSFNPSASLDVPRLATSPPGSPTSILQPSPPKGRHGHRRTRSELPGVDSRHQNPTTHTNASIDKPNEELRRQDLENTSSATVSQGTPARKGHRHRRSAAISKDLTTLTGRSCATSANDLTEASLGQSSPTFGPHYLPAGNDPPITTKASSPVRVTFAEDVEIIPRRSLPTLKSPSIAPSRPIHTSDGTESYQEMSPIRFDYTFDSSESIPERMIDPRSQESPTSPGDFPSVSIVEHANDYVPTTFYGSQVLLSENFDEDPTAAVEVAERYSTAQLPSPRSPSLEFEDNSGPDPVIDLDTANEVSESTALTSEDLRNLRATSFSAARRSMHSGGMDPSSVRSGIPMHRRTESAPSMAAPFFERPPLPRYISDTGDSASEKGFQMDNVFEEDEEESQATEFEEEQCQTETPRRSKQEGLGLGIGSPLSHSTRIESSPLERSGACLRDGSDRHDTPTPTNDSDIPSRSQTIRRVSSNRQSLIMDGFSNNVPGNSTGTLQPALVADSETNAFSLDDGLRPVSQPLPNLAAPPWMHQQDTSSFGSTPHEPSNSSAWSTPKLDTAATSMSDAPQLSLPRAQGDTYTTSSVSTEGIPSLVSSHSTMSGVNQYAGSFALPSTPSGAQSRHSHIGMGSQTERRRKRSSIASLSHLMSLSRSGGGRSNLSVEQDSRCQTSSGLSNTGIPDMSIPSKEKRMKRLSRALKFWKTKEEAAP